MSNESDWVDLPTADDSDWVDVSENKEQDYDWSNAPRDLLQTNIDALPMYGAALGGALGMGIASVPFAGAGAAAGESLKNGINSLWHGEEAKDIPKTPVDILNRSVESFNQGAVSEMGGQIAGKALPMAWSGIKSGANKAGEYLGSQAEKFATNATGATGAQVSKFSDDAGRELLDRGLVKFGDNAENIALRAGQAMDSANADIDFVLKELDAKGVTASVDNVVDTLEKKVAELSKDPSQAGAVRKLNSIIEDVVNTGQSNIPISLGEQTKRGFNKMAGNWMDPEVGSAGKTAYQAYRGEVESAAEAAAPELAKKFAEAKKTYGLLAPIEEAAKKRANTLNQSPFGGLLDVGTVGAGAAAGDPSGGFATALGRKLLAPRVSSSTAVTLDKISRSLMSSPQLAQMAKSNPKIFEELVSRVGQKLLHESTGSISIMQQAAEAPDNSAQTRPLINKDEIIQKTSGSKYQQVLQNAAQKGDASFNAAHYVLSTRDPQYRKQVGN